MVRLVDPREPPAPPRPTRLGADVACDHCGLPVPPGLLEAGAPEHFCCAACRTARRVIRAGGLEAYYDVQRRMGGAGRSAGAPRDDATDYYARFDDPEFLARHAVVAPGGLVSAEFVAPGIHCPACVWLLERAPRLHRGLVEVVADLGRATVRATWDPESILASEVASLLHSLGYPLRPTGEAGLRASRRRQDREMLVRIGVAGAIAGNVMLLSLAIYSGGASGQAIEPAVRTLFRWLTMALGMAAVAWPGAAFYRGAIAALRTRTPHMDVPISLGLTVGAAWGVVCTLRGVGETYFDTMSVLVFLLLVGRWIQRQQQRRAAEALEALGSLTPSSARVVGETGLSVPTPIERIAIGDTVEVRPGETFPVDGEVAIGESEADEALLTGESAPVVVGPGDRVHAGAVNLASTLRIRVTATGEATRAGAIQRLMRECAAKRAPIVRLADRVAGVFTWAVIALALATLGLWLALDPSRAVDQAAALLIVTCPCALGMATPLAITTAIGRAARRGILIKSGEALEALARPGTIVLDKTGTLTRAAPTVALWRGSPEARSCAAALERCVATHPIARALAAPAPGPIPSQRAESSRNVKASVGGGVSGEVDGLSVRVGSPSFLAGAKASPGFDREAFLAECDAQALTPVLISVDCAVVAGAGVGDRARDDARASIDALRGMGWSLRVLSGDRAAVVRRVACEVGIAPELAQGEASPEAKAREIERFRAEPGGSPVVMVGDGVNDAAGLAAATVGVAVHGGAEASLHAADVYLSREGLAPLVELVTGARRTLALIRRTLAASLLYNAVCVALAIAGRLNPVAAAALMPMSSLTILWLTCRADLFPRGNAPFKGQGGRG